MPRRQTWGRGHRGGGFRFREKERADDFQGDGGYTQLRLA